MDRDLLFATLAVQIGFATPQQVMAAASAFLADKSRPIAERLVSDGVLDQTKLEMLTRMVDEAVKVHGGDVRKTVDTLGGERALYASFGGSLVVDAQGEVSLAPEVKGTDESFDDTSASVTPEASGRYRLGEGAEIGRGGIGRVLVAFDEHLGREIAVKELLADVSSSAVSTPRTDRISRTGAIAARFLREARVTGQLEHPNIVPVYEVGQRADGAYYYTMKLVRGRTLAEALKECRGLPDRLKLLHHYVDLCNAIAYAHSRGVIHRDIKTDNVMLGEFGETVVLDWGLAKVKGKQDIRGGEIARELKMLHEAGTGQTVDGSAIGTPAYMSPEQADGNIEEIDERSDIWSLGAVLYEVLTGKPPFEGFTPYEIIGKVLKDDIVSPRAVSEEIPAELSAVALKALTRERSKRYQQAGDVADEINAYMSGGRIGAYEYGSLELLKRFVAKNKAASLLIGLVIVLLIAGGVVLYRAYQRAGEERDRAEAEKVRALNNEHLAELNLATALLEKAERLFEDRRILTSRVYAAAAMVEHPCYGLGLTSTDECNARFPGGALLSTRARSTLFQTQSEVLARPEWVHHGVTSYGTVRSAKSGHLLTQDLDDRVELWDTSTLKRLATFRSRFDELTEGAAIAPDGEMIATVDTEYSVLLWDKNGERLGELPRPKGSQLYSVRFSPRGGELALNTSDGIEIWDTATRALLRTIGDGVAMFVAFSDDGALLAGFMRDRGVLWDMTTGERVLGLGDLNGPIGPGFSHDGTRLAVPSMEDRTVAIFDVGTGHRRHTIPGQKEIVTTAVFSPDDRLLVTTSGDQAVRFYDTRSYELLYVLEGHRAAIYDSDFLADGRLVTAGDDATWRIWRMDASRELVAFEGHAARIWRLSFSPDSRLLASASADGTVRLWSAVDGSVIDVLTVGATLMLGAQFSPDGQRLITTGSDLGVGIGSPITIWDVATRKPLRSLGEAGGMAFGGYCSPDGRYISTNDRAARKVSVWDAETGSLVFELEPEALWQGYPAFSPDSKLLVTGSAEKEIHFWEIGTGRVLDTFTGLPDVPESFAFLKGGRQLLSGGKHGSILLWDVENGRIIKTFAGHKNWINSFSLTPDEQLFVTASDDATVRLWSLDSEEPLLILKMSGETYESVIAPDGKSFAVIDGTKIVIYPLDLSLLDIDPKELLRDAEKEAGMKLEGFSLVPLED